MFNKLCYVKIVHGSKYMCKNIGLLLWNRKISTIEGIEKVDHAHHIHTIHSVHSIGSDYNCWLFMRDVKWNRMGILKKRNVIFKETSAEAERYTQNRKINSKRCV